MKYSFNLEDGLREHRFQVFREPYDIKLEVIYGTFVISADNDAEFLDRLEELVRWRLPGEPVRQHEEKFILSVGHYLVDIKDGMAIQARRPLAYLYALGYAHKHEWAVNRAGAPKTDEELNQSCRLGVPKLTDGTYTSYDPIDGTTEVVWTIYRSGAVDLAVKDSRPNTHPSTHGLILRAHIRPAEQDHAVIDVHKAFDSAEWCALTKCINVLYRTARPERSKLQHTWSAELVPAKG